MTPPTSCHYHETAAYERIVRSTERLSGASGYSHLIERVSQRSLSCHAYHADH